MYAYLAETNLGVAILYALISHFYVVIWILDGCIYGVEHHCVRLARCWCHLGWCRHCRLVISRIWRHQELLPNIRYNNMQMPYWQRHEFQNPWFRELRWDLFSLFHHHSYVGVLGYRSYHCLIWIHPWMYCRLLHQCKYNCLSITRISVTRTIVSPRVITLKLELM